MYDLSFIIINWNAYDVIGKCLQSIRDTCTSITYEIVMLDNNSSDGSVQMVSQLFPEVKIIRLTQNVGFAQGNNIAVKASSGKYLMLLNPDTVLHKSAAHLLLNCIISNPKIGIVGPKIIDNDGYPSYAALRSLPRLFDDFLTMLLVKKMILFLKRKIAKVHPIFRATYFDLYERDQQCECLSGACMLISADFYRSLGGFDEAMPMYLDDNDLCFKSIKCGRINYYLSKATVSHISQHSTKLSPSAKSYDVLALAAHCYYYKKNHGMQTVYLFKLVIAISVPILIGIDILMIPLFLIRGKLNYIFNVIHKHICYTFILPWKVDNYRSLPKIRELFQ